MVMLQTESFSCLKKKKKKKEKKERVEIPYAFVIKSACEKMGKSTRTLFEKSCFWLILEAFGRFLGDVKGYKRRGDREKESQQSNARISRLREREEKARISRLRE